MSDNILAQWQIAVREEKTRLADAIIDGGCKDMEDYAHWIGQIRGLERAESLMVELAEREEELERQD